MGSAIRPCAVVCDAARHCSRRELEEKTAVKPVQPPMNGSQVLDLYYLDMRCHLLELAAALDRVERAGGTDYPRLARLLAAGQQALDAKPERARRLLASLSV